VKWTIESYEDEKARRNAALRERWLFEREWHPWFAWYPVRVSPTEKAWLTIVDRRILGRHRERQPSWYVYDIIQFEHRLRK
jgi:hypothetical protein